MRYRIPICAIAVLTLLLLCTQIASATLATGVLYVYSDSGYSSLVNQDENGRFEVVTGQTVYIQIAGIEEFPVGAEVDVKICWNHTKTFPSETVKILTSGAGIGSTGVGDAADPIAWTVGDFDGGFYSIPVCETMTVHYKSSSVPPGPDYVTIIFVVNGDMVTAHMHSVPENPAGTLGTLLVVLATLVFMTKVRKVPILTR